MDELIERAIPLIPVAVMAAVGCVSLLVFSANVLRAHAEWSEYHETVRARRLELLRADNLPDNTIEVASPEEADEAAPVGAAEKTPLTGT